MGPITSVLLLFLLALNLLAEFDVQRWTLGVRRSAFLISFLCPPTSVLCFLSSDFFDFRYLNLQVEVRFYERGKG
jgi:hypothetical protein